MVVSTQGLTRRLGVSRVSGVEGYKNVWMRDLACTSSPEPLNGMAGSVSLSLPCSVEGRSTPSSGARNRDASTQGGRLSPTGLMPLFLAERAVHPLIPPTPKKVGFLEVI